MIRNFGLWLGWEAPCWLAGHAWGSDYYGDWWGENMKSDVCIKCRREAAA